MPKEEKITLEAEVTEALPDARFKVRLENTLICMITVVPSIWSSDKFPSS